MEGDEKRRERDGVERDRMIGAQRYRVHEAKRVGDNNRRGHAR